MDRIKAQTDKLLQIISDPKTAGTYTQTIAITWTLLKETGYLLWLILCFGLVAGDWFWKKSYETGQSTRTWVDNLQTTIEANTQGGVGTGETGTTNLLSETSKSLLSAGQRGLDLALNTAKEQLGLEVTAMEAKPEPAKPSASPAKAPMAEEAAKEPPVS